MPEDRERNRPVTLILLTIFGLIAIVLGYYVFHKPLSPDQALVWVRVFQDVLVAGLILSIVGGLGRKIFPKPHPSRFASMAFQVSIGVGLIAILLLVLGAVGLLRAWVAVALVVVLSLWLRREVLAWLMGWRDVWQEVCEADLFNRTLMLGCAALFGIAFVEALAPPVAFDALVYHLALPRVFLERNSITPVHGNPYWGMPWGAEMIYTWIMAITRVQSAAVFGWGIGLVGVIGVYGLARELGKRAGWVAVTSLLVGETTIHLLGSAYCDWFALLHGLAVIIALERWWKTRDAQWAMWAGGCAGFALGTKYTAGTVALAGMVGLLWWTARLERLGVVLRFVIGTVLTCAPWFVKNILYSGALVYPFWGSSPWIDPLQQAFFGKISPQHPVLALLAPLMSTVWGIEGASGYAASIGPLLLGLLPGLFLLPRMKRDLLRIPAWFVGIGWMIWGLAGLYSVFLSQSRLYYVLFGPWAILAGGAYVGFDGKKVGQVRVGRLVNTVILLSLTFALLNSLLISVRHRPLSVLLGIQREEEYLSGRLGGFQTAMQEIAMLDSQASVVTLWEPRSFYCLPKCVPDGWLDRWYLLRRREGKAQDILAHWDREGRTHVLVYDAGMAFERSYREGYEESDWTELDGLLSQLTPIIEIGQAYTLYETPP